MISGRQIRAARALLGLSATELANLSGVGWATIQRFESTEDVPLNRSGTLAKVLSTLESHGVEFLGDPALSPGVQLKPLAQRR